MTTRGGFAQSVEKRAFIGFPFIRHVASSTGTDTEYPFMFKMLGTPSLKQKALNEHQTNQTPRRCRRADWPACNRHSVITNEATSPATPPNKEHDHRASEHQDVRNRRDARVASLQDQDLPEGEEALQRMRDHYRRHRAGEHIDQAERDAGDYAGRDLPPGERVA